MVQFHYLALSKMLMTFIAFPLLGAILLCFIPASRRRTIKNTALLWSLLSFLFSIVLYCFFDVDNSNYQLCEEFRCLPFSGIRFIFGIDGLSLLLVLLTAYLIPVCILLSWNYTIEGDPKLYGIAFLFLEFILFGIFFSLDLMIFYVCFEAVLIPMYFIVGAYGSRMRRVRASYMLFLYTLLSSLFMFIAILSIYLDSGTTDLQVLKTVQFTGFLERLY